MRRAILALALVSVWSGGVEAAEGRTRHTITRGDVATDVIAEGKGPLMVLLPSSARDSED